MISRRSVLTAAGIAAASGALGTGLAHADATIAVNPGVEYGRWEGWGTRDRYARRDDTRLSGVPFQRRSGADLPDRRRGVTRR
ncbi:twin-arginine translocation signal domain-containing protein [Kibdelosporangium persicum]|uniref:twin-arginine translocation signal domain-containing protein n=1 Tax=Kibdelosporangium persicum TaxID=2698649 RepID=UPI0015669713|nr:twin-arginine translocation signal domain-containing protein [Kibdelosporangium persicum]